MSGVVNQVPVRYRLPDERESLTKKVKIGRLKVYVTVSVYSDGRPGELFFRLAKGSFFGDSDGELWGLVSGLLDAFAISVSLLLQYGVPLRVVADKHVGGRFAPAGTFGSATGAPTSHQFAGIRASSGSRHRGRRRARRTGGGPIPRP